MTEFWTWLLDENNRGAFGVLVALFVPLAGGGWAFFKWLGKRSNEKTKQAAPASPSQGNTVTINLDGKATIGGIQVGEASPKIVHRLNELLDEKDKQLGEAKRSEQEKAQEAEKWLKDYNGLKEKWKESTDELSSRARQLFDEGNFKEAGEALDQTLKKQDEQTTSNHYKRGKIWELEFEIIKALPHFEKAYTLNPNDPEYAHSYAQVLHRQNQFSTAEEPYVKALKVYCELAESNPAVYADGLAQTLLGLAFLYKQSGNPEKGCEFARGAEEKAWNEQLKQIAQDYLSEQ